MIEFTHETTRYKVLPENAQAIRTMAAKPPKIKRKVDRSHDATRRDYPAFYSGMTTDEYVSTYAGLNSRLLLKGEGFTFADRAAPMLDPSVPEVLEELDPDYVPDFLRVSAKPKKQTVASLTKSITQALALLAQGDADTAQCVLSEAIK